MMPYDMNDYNNEKDIQKTIRDFFEQECFGKIVEEVGSGGNYPELQLHQFLLINDLTSAIERLNSDLWDRHQYKESKEKIISIILENFKKAFDECTYPDIKNRKIHHLVFGRDIRTITLTKLDGKPDELVGYRVLDTDYTKDCRNNDVVVIKEKIIRKNRHSTSLGYDTEIPDFAVYVNGIPFIAVEVKNPLRTEGISKAFEDYKKKKTYHGFISCLCTDGTNVAITANPYGGVDKWNAYGDHPKSRHSTNHNGFFDFCEEILFNTKNLIFYFQFGLFPAKEDKDINHLSNLRVQQYYVMKATRNMLEQNPTNDPIREVVKHPPRSGKTIAIRSIINMIISLEPNRYNKFFIQVPDLTIMKQFVNDFSNFKFANGFTVKEIDSRRSDSKVGAVNSYEDAILEKNNHCIYIMNMQKISEDIIDAEDPGCNVLIFLDEVHTHQLGQNSKIRERNFPNASYITFTATTRKEAKGDLVIDHTLNEYSSSGKYLDELYNADAKDLGMIIPVVYEKKVFKTVFNEEKKKISRELSESINSSRTKF